MMSWTALHPTCGNHRGLSGRESQDGHHYDDRVGYREVGIDAAGEVVVRRRLSRGRILAFFEKLPRCLVGMEACNTSHYWARELIALGHDVRLMPAQYVKPYVKRGKNDAADAEAICEAVCAAYDAVRGSEDTRAAEHHDAASGAADAQSATHATVERGGA